MLSKRLTTKSRNRCRKRFLVDKFQIYSVLQEDMSKTIVPPLQELFLNMYISLSFKFSSQNTSKSGIYVNLFPITFQSFIAFPCL